MVGNASSTLLCTGLFCLSTIERHRGPGDARNGSVEGKNVGRQKLCLQALQEDIAFCNFQVLVKPERGT
jgi:hypothetical protein